MTFKKESQLYYVKINSVFNSQAKYLPKAGTNVDWFCPILVVIWFVRTTYKRKQKQTNKKMPRKVAYWWVGREGFFKKLLPIVTQAKLLPTVMKLLC